MNLEEIKKACNENLTVINSSHENIEIVFVGSENVIAKTFADCREYTVKLEDTYIKKWKLKPVMKKYYLWKIKQNSTDILSVTIQFYDDEFRCTQGALYLKLRDAHYKEKIESTIHEE